MVSNSIAKRRKEMNEFQYTILDRTKPRPDWLHPSVMFGRNVVVGMFTVIEENVKLGSNCFIGPQCNIRPGSVLGKRVELMSHITIDPNVVIGDRTKIYPHATVGGGTVVGEDVYYGPYCLTTNSSVPGVIDPPIIEDGAKIYAGSMIGPGVVIGKGAIVGMGSDVTKSIGDGQVWFGESARFRRYIRKIDLGIMNENSPWPYSELEFLDELNEHNRRKNEGSE